MEEKEMVESEMFLPIPMMPIEQLRKLTAYVAEVKKALMVKGQDYIQEGGRQYTARSGFAKLGQGFGLSDDSPVITKLLESEEKQYVFEYNVGKQRTTATISTNVMGFEAVVTVRNKYGRYATGEGACTVEELHLTNNMSPKWYHRAYATAKTRAYNRAVSNFVGSAEVSAEEMGLTYPGDEDRKQVEVENETVEVYIPDDLSKPTWSIGEAIGMEGWDSAQKTVEAYLADAGVALLGNIDVSSDAVKVQVKPPKDRKYTKSQVAAISRLLLDQDFTYAEQTGTWRFNKPKK